VLLRATRRENKLRATIPRGEKPRRGAAGQGGTVIAGLDCGNGLQALKSPAGRWGRESAAERVVKRFGKETEEAGREW
jgi:hypothetical protein